MVPTGAPPTVQAYVGVAPPFVGVAVKVTLVPEQIAPLGDALTLTEGVKFGLTVKLTAVLAAVVELTHPSLDVSVHTTGAPLVNVVVV